MRVLVAIFLGILLAMLGVTAWATSKVALWNAWGDLKDPWTIATLFDAYFGFLTFYLWVFYKERRNVSRLVWFVLVMALGNIAMSFYVLLQIRGLKGRGNLEQQVIELLTKRVPISS